MAWTAPRTWVTSEVVTASVMNTHVRDNFLVTAPAVATATTGFILSSGSNTVVERASSVDSVATSEGTASTSYTDLATSGPTVTITTGVRAFVMMQARAFNSTANSESWMGFAISGATTLSAADSLACMRESGANNQDGTITFASMVTGLTSGSNTFTAKYRANANTANFQYRRLAILPA